MWHHVLHFNLELLMNYDIVISFSKLRHSSLELKSAFSVKALHHIRQIAQETSGDVTHTLGKQPAVLRAFRQKLSR